MSPQFAQLPKLSYAQLRVGGEDEALRTACMNDGAFYLEISDGSDWSWQLVDSLLGDARAFFALPYDRKGTVAMTGSSYDGYKPKGNNIVDAQGTPDQNEFFNVSKHDALLKQCNVYTSRGLVSTRAAENISRFIILSHDILTTILTRLSSALDLDPSDDLSNLHRRDAKSGDHLRFVKYLPEVTSLERNPHIMLIPHTDFGTLTLLYSRQPGLEVMSPSTQAWEPVEPKKEHFLVMVGDALVKFTNGLLHSCLHRVSHFGGLVTSDANETTAEKLSLGYFLRPEDDALLCARPSFSLKPATTDEEPVRSDEWIKSRVTSSLVSSYASTANSNWLQMRGTASNWKER
ncbi:putative oxoglutarate iron-dependent dioxygenase [Rosellinia necatrix]|uniref:Putative oxoglutarate iron-dependent dioxygenase n=1 Tax=Rosellinia necatrix TaxID=77044 RepID=A0A1W2TTA2_ROSNE|nr:putative oxoglutarate iron-dependent dioxygenase [Rosellinia necatrix]